MAGAGSRKDAGGPPRRKTTELPKQRKATHRKQMTSAKILHRRQTGRCSVIQTENRTADFCACPVFRFSIFAAPEWGFPGAGSVSIHFAHTYAKMEPAPGKFSEEGGSEGGRLFQEVPSLRGLSFPLRKSPPWSPFSGLKLNIMQFGHRMPDDLRHFSQLLQKHEHFFLRNILPVNVILRVLPLR